MPPLGAVAGHAALSPPPLLLPLLPPLLLPLPLLQLELVTPTLVALLKLVESVE